MVKFRATEKELREYKNLLSTAKRRINTANMKGYDISNDINLVTLSKIENKKQFNELKAQLKTFKHSRQYKYVQLGDGSYVPEKEYEQVKTQNRIANFLRDKKRKQIHKLEDAITKEDVILSKYEYGQRQSTADIQNLPPIPKPKGIRNLARFQQLKKHMEQKSDRKYLDEVANRGRENFLRTLEQLVPGSEEMVAIFRSMDVEEFWFMYKKNEEFARVFFGSKQDELRQMGVETTYEPPKVTELRSAYESFEKEKEEARNKPKRKRKRNWTWN